MKPSKHAVNHDLHGEEREGHQVVVQRQHLVCEVLVHRLRQGPGAVVPHGARSDWQVKHTRVSNPGVLVQRDYVLGEVREDEEPESFLFWEPTPRPDQN